jgi:AcrR family transcriptional regulator
MRQVADDLGITATALYNHFPNKDALLDEVAGQIYATIPAPDPALPWTERLRCWLLAQENVHLDHPGLARFLLARHGESPAAFRWLETVAQILSEGGLDAEDQAMCTTQIGFLHNPLIYLDAPQREREARSASVDSSAHRSLLLRHYPHLSRLESRWSDSPRQEDFERALQNAIDGMAAAVKARRGRRGSRRATN